MLDFYHVVSEQAASDGLPLFFRRLNNEHAKFVDVAFKIDEFLESNQNCLIGLDSVCAPVSTTAHPQDHFFSFPKLTL